MHMNKQEFLKTRAGVHFLVRNARMLRRRNVKMSVQQFLQSVNDRMVVGEVTDFWESRAIPSAGILIKDPETGDTQFCMGNDPVSLAWELWNMGWYN